MKTGDDGRVRIELQDIDLRAGFHAYRWFWMFYGVLFLLWVFS